MMILPLVGLVQTVHVGDEGALAGAGGSDDAHEIALFHLKLTSSSAVTAFGIPGL